MNKTLPVRFLKSWRDSDSKCSKRGSEEDAGPLPELLAELARDADERVRLAVACNPKVTREILEWLRDDEWATIREAVGRRFSEMGE